MQSENSLLSLQKPTIGPYPKPHAPSPHAITEHSTLILYSNLCLSLPCGYHLFGFVTNIFYELLTPYMQATYLLILLTLIWLRQ